MHNHKHLAHRLSKLQAHIEVSLDELQSILAGLDIEIDSQRKQRIDTVRKNKRNPERCGVNDSDTGSISEQAASIVKLSEKHDHKAMSKFIKSMLAVPALHSSVISDLAGIDIPGNVSSVDIATLPSGILIINLIADKSSIHIGATIDPRSIRRLILSFEEMSIVINSNIVIPSRLYVKMIGNEFVISRFDDLRDKSNTGDL